MTKARPDMLGLGHRVSQAFRVVTASNLFRGGFALAVFVGAVVALRRELAGSSFSAILQIIAAASPWAIGGAIAATLGSYVALAMSEAWALGCLGRNLRARQVGLVTFVAYAMSNSMGFSVATGGAARLRFYRGWGLTSAEVAAVTLLAGAAVTLSGLVTAGLALLFSPGVPHGVKVLAPLFVAPVLLWLAPLPRTLGFLPGVALERLPLARRLRALAGGVADWLLSGLALFVLLPGASGADFLPFMVIFVLGSVVSAASGVPGGIGVFDAIVLALSREFSLPHETAAALLLYRLIYAVGPLLLVGLGLALVQVFGRLGPKDSARPGSGPRGRDAT